MVKIFKRMSVSLHLWTNKQKLFILMLKKFNPETIEFFSQKLQITLFFVQNLRLRFFCRLILHYALQGTQLKKLQHEALLQVKTPCLLLLLLLLCQVFSSSHPHYKLGAKASCLRNIGLFWVILRFTEESSGFILVLLGCLYDSCTLMFKLSTYK